MGGAKEDKVEKEGEKQEIPNRKISDEVEETQKDYDSKVQDKKEEVSSCCQGTTNGFTCCQEVSSETKETPAATAATTVEAKKGGGLGKISAWVGNLDQSDVLAGVGVATAVVAVAVAYSFYKRSG